MTKPAAYIGLCLAVLLLLAFAIFSRLAEAETLLEGSDADRMWTEYYERINNRRLAEAGILWTKVVASNASSETIFAVDFLIFCAEADGAEEVTRQLSENYTIETRFSQKQGVWLIQGTTRPTGVMLSQEIHTEWVRFMVDVASQYGCVFTNWPLEVPKLALLFRSEEIETGLP